MPDRTDHFQRIRGEQPQAEPEEGAPVVTPYLITWLQKQGFGQVKVEPNAYPGTRDHEVATCHGVTYAGGQLSVIQYLMTLVNQGA